MSDGRVEGDNIICGVHNWDYRLDTGISEYNNREVLQKFSAWIENGDVLVDADEIHEWEQAHPQPWKRDQYQGLYADHSGNREEPHTGFIQSLAKHGLSKTGHHGPVAAMGVPLHDLPRWDDIQFTVAQLARRPLLDDVPAVQSPHRCPPAHHQLW